MASNMNNSKRRIWHFLIALKQVKLFEIYGVHKLFLVASENKRVSDTLNNNIFQWTRLPEYMLCKLNCIIIGKLIRIWLDMEQLSSSFATLPAMLAYFLGRYRILLHSHF